MHFTDLPHSRSILRRRNFAAVRPNRFVAFRSLAFRFRPLAAAARRSTGWFAKSVGCRPTSMADVLMEVDDDSVLRWRIADFLQRWRQTDDRNFLTSGLFVLKPEDGEELRLFLQLEKNTGGGKKADSKIHFRCPDGTSDWTRPFADRPLWIEREDGAPSAEKEIEVDMKHETRSNFVTLEELAEFEEGETLTICLRFDPPTAVFPLQLQRTHLLSQHNVGDLPNYETYGEAFGWKTEVAVEKIGKLCLELNKEAERMCDHDHDDELDDNPIIAKLILPQLSLNMQEVIVKYDLWLVNVDLNQANWDAEPADRQPRTLTKGNIASFTADRKEAAVEFADAIGEYWEGRLDLLIHGYRVVPQTPPVRMDGNPVTSRFDQKFNDAAFTDVRIVVGARVFHVYTAFLFLHSDVFRVMFEHEWRERESNIISIEGIEAPIVEAMLRFMYTGRVENLEQNARHLFLAADKYDVELLRDLTIDHLCAKVSLENVVEMMAFSLEHPTLEKLREWALDFAARHYPQLHDRVEWKDFAAQHPPLVLRLMEKAFTHE